MFPVLLSNSTHVHDALKPLYNGVKDKKNKEINSHVHYIF